jgi:hypothetical protein
MDVAVAVKDLVGSCEGAFQVFILILIQCHRCAAKGVEGNGVRNPLVEDDFQRDRGRSQIAVELDLKEVSLD